MDSAELLRQLASGTWNEKKRKKLSDDAATDKDNGAFVLRRDVVWTDNIENDGQRKIAVGNQR